MKRLVVSLLIATLSCKALPAQAPAKSVPPAAAARGVSDHDLNIRAYIELLRSDVKKQKAQVIGVVMQLDSEQSATFWPIYKNFEKDYARIGDQIVELIRSYTDNSANMTAAVADQLAKKLLDIEQQRNDLKRNYYEKLKVALDPVTAARFLQVENQLEKLLDLQIAAELPVMKESGR